MTGWAIVIMTSMFAALMALIIAPAWGDGWIFLPWLGWWYMAARHIASVAQRLGGLAPVVLVGVAVAPVVPWAMIALTAVMVAAAEGAEQYLFPQRRRAAYGAAAVASVAVWPWQATPFAMLGVLVVSMALTHSVIRLKRWWWL
jgi:hypothetical protein